MIKLTLLEKLRAVEPYIYVASPYSKFPGGTEAAFREVSRAAAWLIRQGVRVYCPISHTHPIAIYGGMDPLDHAIWLPCDQPFMKAAGAIVVVQMETWNESYGIAVEVREFEAAGKPVHYIPWPQL